MPQTSIGLSPICVSVPFLNPPTGRFTNTGKRPRPTAASPVARSKTRRGFMGRSAELFPSFRLQRTGGFSFKSDLLSPDAALRTSVTENSMKMEAVWKVKGGAASYKAL